MTVTKKYNSFSVEHKNLCVNIINDYVSDMEQKASIGTPESLEVKLRNEIYTSALEDLKKRKAVSNPFKITNKRLFEFIIPNDKIAFVTAGFVLSGVSESEKYSVPNTFFTNAAGSHQPSSVKAYGEHFYTGVTPTLRFVNAHSLFTYGLFSAFKSNKTGDCQVVLVDKEAVREYLFENQVFAKEFFSEMARQQSFSYEKFRLKSVGGVLYFLSCLCENFSDPSTIQRHWAEDGSLHVHIDQDRYKLSWITFLSREYVGRMIKEMEEDGLCEAKTRGLILKKIEV